MPSARSRSSNRDPAANRGASAGFEMRAVKRVSVADAVHDQLRTAILSGAQPVGSVLPAETELAAQAGVNRQAVREALQRLRQVGLVEIIQGGGAHVLDWRVNGTLSLLTEALLRTDAPVEPQVIESVFRLRLVTLVDAARLCADRRPPDVIEQLTATVSQMRAAPREDGDDDDANRLVQRGIFWHWIVVGSGNLAYRLVYNTQLAIARTMPAESVQALLQGAEIVESYARLAAAVAAGDEDSAAHAAEEILAPSVAYFAELS